MHDDGLAAELSGALALQDETLDLLLRDRVALLQARTGYRTSVDSLLLAAFASALPGSPPSRFIDLGAGTGLVAMLLALHAEQSHATLVERQASMAARARRNLLLNDLAGRATVLERDVAEPWPDAPQAPLVVSNPPYFRTAGRMLPRDRERAEAHYESTAPIERFAAVAGAMVEPGGTAVFVYPFEGHTRLLHGLADAGLGARELHPFVHRDLGEAPGRVLIVARHGASSLQRFEPQPIHLRDPPDSLYSPALQAFVESLPTGAAARARKVAEIQRQAPGNKEVVALRGPGSAATLKTARGR